MGRHRVTHPCSPEAITQLQLQGLQVIQFLTESFKTSQLGQARDCQEPGDPSTSDRRAFPSKKSQDMGQEAELGLWFLFLIYHFLFGVMHKHRKLLQRRQLRNESNFYL